MTLLDMIVRQLKTIGVYSVGDTLDAEEAMDAALINMLMVQSWDASGLLTYSVTKESFTLTAAKATYDWGSTATAGNFVSARPVKLLRGFVRDVNGSDYPLEIITDASYNGLTIKTEQGRPYYVFYNPTFPLGTVYLFYVPDQVYTIFLDSDKTIVNWSNLTDTLNLPPEYLAAMHWNGAAELAPGYKKPASPKVEIMADKTLAIVKRLNASVQLQPVKMNAFPGQRNQSFFKAGDIRSGNPNF